MLAPAQIAQRLDQRFRLLTGGNPRALPRHQTMTALIDWSYDLLTDRERRFFESLSVFAGGCTLDAATAVCADDDEDDIQVVDLLASLVAKSLVVAELAGSEQRYRISESSRQYARDKLIAHGENEALARRHAVFYVELAERLQSEWDKMSDCEWLPQVTVELGNWRMVLEWALAKRSDVVLGQRLAAVQAVMWRGFTLTEGRRWVGEALRLVDDGTPPRLIAQLAHSEAEGARRFADFTAALDAAERAWLRYRKLGDVRKIAETQSLVGGMLKVLGRNKEAEPILRDGLEMAEKIGDIRLRATCLQRLGMVKTWLGDFTGAGAYLTEALGLAKVVGATMLSAAAGTALSHNAYRSGDVEAALRVNSDVIADLESLHAPGTVSNIVNCLTDGTTFLIALGRYDEALRTGATRRWHSLAAFSSHLCSAGRCNSSRSQRCCGLRLKEQAQPSTLPEPLDFLASREPRITALTAGEGLEELDRDIYERARARLREALAADELARMMAVGAAMTEEEAIAQAHALE